MASRYKEELDQVIWSFSTCHLYETCPYAFYKYKIEGDRGEENFYAENGKAMHTVFQKLEAGEISLAQAPREYLDEYDCITATTRKSIMSNTFDACIDYLCGCDDEYLKKYEVLWVEERTHFDIGNYHFTGFVDLLLRNRQTGELVLVDHKSSPPFFGKKGRLLKNQQDNFISYRHQMHLYCKPIYERFGQFPVKIVWHHFKNNGELSQIDFEMGEYEKSLAWAEGIIERIYSDEEFVEQKSYMQCRELCNYRNTCEYKE